MFRNHPNARSRGVRAALALAAFAAGAHATTFNVNTTSMNLVNDGNCGLREAIANITSGSAAWGCPAPDGTSETVYLPPGTYSSPATLTVGRSFNLICNGPGACNVDAGNSNGPLFLITGASDPHLYMQKIILRQPSTNANSVTGVSVQGGSVGMEDGTVTGFKLNGLVISDGYATTNRVTFSNNASMGIFVAPFMTANIASSTLTGNSQNGIVTGPNAIVSSQYNAISNNGQAGVALSQYTQFNDEGSVISNNGGAGIDGAGDVTLTRTVLRGNLNSGVRMDGGFGTFSYVTIEGNRTSGNGGGVAILVPSFVNLTSSTISNNKAAGNGGGLYLTGGANLYHCTISNDTAARGGGFYHNPGGSGGNAYVEVYQGTVAYNHATIAGGGAFPISGSSPFRTKGCIVAQNTAPTHPDVSGWINSENTMYSNVTGFTGSHTSDYFPFNPLLGPLMDNGGPNRVKTRALLKGSPALDKISPPQGIALAEQDERGFPRPTEGSGGLWDLGAYEDGPFETELLTVIGQSSDAHYVQSESGLSNRNGTILDANAVNDFVTYAVAIPEPGTYSFVVRVKRGPGRGIAELATSPATTTFTPIATFDLYRSSPGFTSFTTSFAFTSAGVKHFRFRVTGKNASSSGYLLYLDYVKLTKQ